jgi:hypothetical protein
VSFNSLICVRKLVKVNVYPTVLSLPYVSGRDGSYRFRTVVTVSERHLPFQNGICHGMSVVATAVTVSERQLPFQNGICHPERHMPWYVSGRDGSYRFRTAVTVPERHMPWYVSGRGGTCHRPLNDLGVSQVWFQNIYISN